MTPMHNDSVVTHGGEAPQLNSCNRAWGRGGGSPLQIKYHTYIVQLRGGAGGRGLMTMIDPWSLVQNKLVSGLVVGPWSPALGPLFRLSRKERVLWP